MEVKFDKLWCWRTLDRSMPGPVRKFKRDTTVPFDFLVLSCQGTVVQCCGVRRGVIISLGSGQVLTRDGYFTPAELEKFNK